MTQVLESGTIWAQRVVYCYLIVTLLLQEAQKQRDSLFRLFLLRPMARAADQFADQHAGAGLSLHALECSWRLVYAPVATAGEKEARHVDGPTREKLLLAGEKTRRGHTIPLQPALEAIARIFLGVDSERVIRQPAVTSSPTLYLTIPMSSVR